MKFLVRASSILAFISLPIFAQTACPIGTAAGSATCGPSPSQGGGIIQQQAPTPSGEWIKTWGAIAVGNSTGDVGLAVGKMSKEQAENEALIKCAQNGALDCKQNLFTYRNQCAALAWPNTAGEYVIIGGPSKDTAAQEASSACGKKASAGCRVVYSECSEPYFRKF
ncbi:DUF4189 domain-containing protein [Variovorax ginsengisoli]|uniref:DUF4189 domain-containing protein n=1 Tax=Variovorax ginsengisoli TaxID=363844 RepID=UPI0027D90E89|nr:DUF4189 domain-containing protein [Variovorax ginsengisoli]